MESISFFSLALIIILSIGFLFATVGCVSVVISLFASWGRRQEHFTMKGDVHMGTDVFFRAVSSQVGVPLEDGGALTLLQNGDEIFPAMLGAIASAKHSVHIMVFIWNDGLLSDMFLAALAERLAAGVEVRLLIDSLGGIRAPEQKFLPLTAAGATVAWYRKFEFGKLTRFHRRSHRRSIVIDGSVAFTGGMSISDEWLGNAQSSQSWRDCMFGVDGIMAQRLQDVFVQSWHAATGEILQGAEYFPPFMPQYDTRFMSIVSSPTDDVHPIRTLFWLSLAAAQKSIIIANAYFVPDEIIRAILKERARAGVSVRVLVPNKHNDMPPVQWAGRYYYEDMLMAGVEIAEYQPTMMHSKFIVVDGVWSIVGSANVDVRSKELNEENVFAVYDKVLGGALAKTFSRDSKKALAISLARWRRRGFWWRTKEAVSALFTEQF